MSTPFVADDFHLNSPTGFTHTTESLHYAVAHVCLPTKIPDTTVSTAEMDLSLVRCLRAAAHAYFAHISRTSKPLWSCITRMLDSLLVSLQSERLDKDHVYSLLREMQVGDTLVFLLRSHNSTLVITRRQDNMLLESFDMSPNSDTAPDTAKSSRAYPSCAVEIPEELINSGEAYSKLANFFSHSTDTFLSDSHSPSSPPQHVVTSISDMFEGVGYITDVLRVVKHVRGHVRQLGGNSAKSIWQRSSIWLLVKVALQMSLDRSAPGRISYKTFMLFFVCTIATDTNIAALPSDLLHSIGSKIIRRLKKIGLSIPDWLSQMAQKACAGLREVYEARVTELGARSSPFRNPSQEELIRDTRLSLEHSGDYIRRALENHPREPVDKTFRPSCRRRGTLDDFLSADGTFFDEAYEADPEVTMYDVEQAVEHELDDWLADVRGVDTACMQVEVLMDKYTVKQALRKHHDYGPEAISVTMLTVLELFVALDKLVLVKIPFLANYSPEIPLALLERLLFHSRANIHRLSRVYLYFFERHSKSGWSIFSEDLTEDSFAVRYHDQSPLHQQLRARIEKDDDVKSFRLPLFNFPLHAKTIAFELQCPPSFRAWRRAIVQILLSFCHASRCKFETEDENNLLARDAKLQCYFVDRDGPPLEVNVYFLCDFPTGTPGQNPIFRCAVRYPKAFVYRNFRENEGYLLSIWRNGNHGDHTHFSSSYRTISRGVLSKFVSDICHTSNDVLAAQSDCPASMSLEEFVTFGKLRSGGSLQWLNILRGLRNRTLNLRYSYFHHLLSQAIFQVGPLNTSTGGFIWHEDLQELSFCNALLDELENTFAEVGGAIDGIVMNTISLLLTRVLASSPGEDVSKRVVSFLCSVRRKTFSWIQESLYSLSQAPSNPERVYILLEMAATCQGTFDTEPNALPGLFQSAEDVDAALSSVLLIRSLSPKPGYGQGFPVGSCIHSGYSLLSFQRGNRLCLVLERILGNMILTDVSDFGVDLAVSKIFPRYKPNAHGWEQLHHPNSHWFACETKEGMNQPSLTVYLNLLKGEVWVDGQMSAGILCLTSHKKFHDPQVWKHIFDNQGFFVVPSSLPGMDFTTHVMVSEKRVHFSLRSNNLVIRLQSNQSKDILELIPQKMMEKDLPSALVQRHVHWLNLSTKIIEIRPLEYLWEESLGNWRIDCRWSHGQYRAYRGHETLVNIGSPTWAMASRCFEPLNISSYMIRSNNPLVTTTSVESSSSEVMPLRLSVASFHYDLSFSVNNEGELESNDFKHMVYDENQCAGTLLGVRDIIILRQKSHLPQGLLPKLVLIPNGSPIYRGDHQLGITEKGSFPMGSCNGGMYHVYSVDTELGCMVGNGSTSSTGYLAHLYAATSCDWPDPLTGESGAQTSCTLFHSGACRSIMKYKALNVGAIWTPSSRYPEIKSVLEDIQLGYYWNPESADSSKYAIGKVLEKRATHYKDTYHSWNTFAFGPAPDNCKSIKSEHSTDYVHIYSEDITLHHLFLNRSPPFLPPPCYITLPRESHRQSPDHIPELKQLFPSLPMKQSNLLFSTLEQEYVAQLEKSAQCTREASQITHRLVPGEDHVVLLQKYFTECRQNYFGALTTVKQNLSPTSSPYEQALGQFGQWPPVTGETLLRFLASSSPIKLRREWKTCLVSLALLLLELQRARRLLQYTLAGQEEDFSKELNNEGCDGWDPEEFPDWLLIQIQGNFLIRRTQAEVAKEMISPQSGENTVMQVNMGEGKSSVIIPIVAAALANGEQLVRVIVPKPLKAQMFDLLVARLGRLTNRPIYHLPFSRSPDSDDNQYRFVSLRVDSLQKFMAKCMANRGIVLVQPEHVASLKLMNVMRQVDQGHLLVDSSPLKGLIWKNISSILMEKQLSNDSFLNSIFRSLRRPPGNDNDFALADNRSDGNGSNNASKWFDLNKWIQTYTRDILDESDDILRPRFQLIYTVGDQQHMDGYPDRWMIIQQVLQLVKESADTLSKNHPDCIEYEPGPLGSFPRVRFVRASAVFQRLVPMIVEDVMAGRLPSVNIRDISNPSLQCAIRSFISDKDASRVPDTMKRVEDYARRSDQSSMWNCLLLLRGLLTSNILLFTLIERRWRVDYGLTLSSQFSHRMSHPAFVTMLAVPFRAKDLPAPNTQFGHPDVTVILTCLSYYYDGLTEGELRISFEILLDEDDPTTEYARWVKEYSDVSMPDSLRKLGEINLKPSEQWDGIVFPLFSRNQAAINFYLSRVVFPKEAKQCPWKFSSSSWDLVEKREKLVTGFSGTNDSRWLLPMSVVQHSLQHEDGTNAKVLAYLLRPENNFYRVALDKNNSARASTVDLLQMISEQHPKIRVLVDAGAQILDLPNDKVAKTWLNIDRNAVGVIYFSNLELMAVSRSTVIPNQLMTSPLLQHLDRCIVYLDHAHTRGTDIKLPIGSRAAVTLGPKMTKDNLVQACMRMRKLGRGHSVMFFSPPEVDASIRSVTGKKDQNVRVNVADVLCWTIHETWSDIRQQAPYWAQQGMDHRLRYGAWSRYCNNDITLQQLSDAWLQRELKSLDELYVKNDNGSATSLALRLDPDIHRRCKDLGIISLPSTWVDEEQEREVHREKEREREEELPPKAEPADHFLHHDVETFVKTGVIPPLECTTAFRPVFTTLDKSSAASVEADVWSPFILATADFCNTIKPESTKGTMDQYLRPVQWLLSSKTDRGEVLALISPFEADRLMPYIRASRHVHLHLYAPRTSKRMKPSDDLTFYSIPPLPSDWKPSWSLIDQLNVFAGQLYLSDYNSYLRICRFLGEPTKDSQNDEALEVRRNVFKVPGSFEENEITFSGSPLPFVMALLAIRTRGKPFAHTHMGRILYGQPLGAKDFGGTYAQSVASDQDSSLPPSSDMDDEDPRPSASLLPKRRLEGFETSDTCSERPHKRRCSGR